MRCRRRPRPLAPVADESRLLLRGRARHRLQAIGDQAYVDGDVFVLLAQTEQRLCASENLGVVEKQFLTGPGWPPRESSPRVPVTLVRRPGPPESAGIDFCDLSGVGKPRH